MPGPQRQVFRFPSYRGGFRGLLLREGITDEAFQGGYLTACTNLHLVGRGRLLKRKGHQYLISARPNGSNAIQGLAMYEFGTTRHLVAVSGGKIMAMNGSVWDDLTGGLTIVGGQNNIVRFTQFSQGSAGAFLIGNAPGSNALWKWGGSGSATALIPSGNPGPKYATDVEEFQGRLFACGTDSGNTATEYSEDGVASRFPPENAFHATRGSKAMGLSRHNDGALLIFHQRSIHRLEPVYDSVLGDPFGLFLVDNSVGAESTYGIVNSKGVTYFLSKRGPHRVRNPKRPAEYIGWKIEDYWNSLNQSRIPFFVGFERGEPWNEIVWLVSTGSNTQNNAAIIYNTELDAWSVFEGTLPFSCGVNWTTSTGKEVTVLGGYDGYVSEAWGDDNYDTGNVDGEDSSNPQPITTTIKTGAMEWGYPGLKRLRETWVDLQLDDEKTFTYSIEGLAGSTAGSKTQEIGAEGAKFGSIIFGQSRFASDTPTQAKIIESSKARLFRITLSESDTGNPYTLNAMRFWWRMSGRRIKAIA